MPKYNLTEDHSWAELAYEEGMNRSTEEETEEEFYEEDEHQLPKLAYDDYLFIPI